MLAGIQVKSSFVLQQWIENPQSFDFESSLRTHGGCAPPCCPWRCSSGCFWWSPSLSPVSMQSRVQSTRCGNSEQLATSPSSGPWTRLSLFVSVALSSLLPATGRARLPLSPRHSVPLSEPWTGGAAKPSQGWCLIVIVKYLDASARNNHSPQSLHNCHHHLHLISHSQDSHVVNSNKQSYLHLFNWIN